MLWLCGLGMLNVIHALFVEYKLWMPAYDASLTTNKKNVLLFGESAITHSITAACPCGLSKTTDVHSANKNGLYRGLADDCHNTLSKVLACSQHISPALQYTADQISSCKSQLLSDLITLVQCTFSNMNSLNFIAFHRGLKVEYKSSIKISLKNLVIFSIKLLFRDYER